MQILVTFNEVGEQSPYSFSNHKKIVLIDGDGNPVEEDDFNPAKIKEWMDKYMIDGPVDLTQFGKKTRPSRAQKLGRFELGKLLKTGE